MVSPFLDTGKALVDIETGQIKFRLNDDQVTFNICQSMKQPKDMRLVFVMNTIEEYELVHLLTKMPSSHLSGG